MSLITSPSNAIGSLFAILALAVVHLWVRELRRIADAPRYAILSAGIGASLAYVLMRLLPKLAEKQEAWRASVDSGLRGFLEHHAYLVALIGLVTYYGVSRIAAYGAESAGSVSPSRYRAALIATIASYGGYSLLIGYLIVNRLHFGLFSVVLITVGMGTLFLVTDHGLRRKWSDLYDRRIRWVLAAALLAGWALGISVEVSANVVALWYAFLAGVMLINTIGEKLMIEQRGSFWAFLAGVVAFTALLLALEQLPQLSNAQDRLNPVSP